MTKTLLTNQAEWRALVASWVLGVASSDDNLRSTATHEELAGCLHVDPQAVNEFATTKMSPLTLAYANMLADNAEVAPKQYPAVVLWNFITIPFAEPGEANSFLFLGGSLAVVTPDDFE
jgi:hypothetical protein